MLVIFVTSFAFLLCIKLLFADSRRNFYYNSRSMEPTIPYGAKVLWESLKQESIRRGDLVVYLPKGNSFLTSREAYVSRVIAIPGDKVAVGENVVIINDILYKGGDLSKVKHYPDPGYVVSGELVISGEFKKMGDDEYFVISDNWSNAVDSRVFGGLNAHRIIGKVVSIN